MSGICDKLPLHFKISHIWFDCATCQKQHQYKHDRKAQAEDDECGGQQIPRSKQFFLSVEEDNGCFSACCVHEKAVDIVKTAFPSGFQYMIREIQSLILRDRSNIVLIDIQKFSIFIVLDREKTYHVRYFSRKWGGMLLRRL